MAFLDATSAILFRKLGIMGTLAHVGTRVAITRAVLEEINLRENREAKHVDDLPALEVHDPPSTILVLDEALGLGERESISACAVAPKDRIFVSDDRLAQTRAAECGVMAVDSRSLLWVLMVHSRIDLDTFARGIEYLAGSPAAPKRRREGR